MSPIYLLISIAILSVAITARPGPYHRKSIGARLANNPIRAQATAEKRDDDAVAGEDKSKHVAKTVIEKTEKTEEIEEGDDDAAHPDVVIHDSEDLKAAAADSDGGNDDKVSYEREFLRQIAVKLRSYMNKIADNVLEIDHNVLQPLNHSLSQTTTTTTTTTTSTTTTTKAPNPPSKPPSKPTEEPPAENSKKIYRPDANGDMQEVDLDEECDDRPSSTTKKPVMTRKKTTKTEVMVEQVPSATNGQAEKQARAHKKSQDDVNVYAEMFLQEQPDQSHDIVDEQ